MTREALPYQAIESRANLNLIFECQLILDDNVKYGMYSRVRSVVSDAPVMLFDKGDTFAFVKRKPFARDWRGFRIVPVHGMALFA